MLQHKFLLTIVTNINYIVPVAGDDNSYTTADILIRLKYTEDPNNKESTDQYIGDITISDSYTNKDNGYSYKTNIVSFDVSDESYNTKVKYSFDITNQDGYTYTKYVQYYIKNFIVNGNRFTTDLDEFDYNNKRYDIYVTGLTTMNVNSFNSTSSILFDKTSNIDFSDKLNKIDRFLIFCRFDLKLPNSLKIINSFDISSLSQSEFTIPLLVEEISDYAFAYLSQTLINSTSEDSKSSTEKQKIKVTTKFKS